MKNRGITLIALAVTVIVLLIISGVTISYMTGENGIINQSKESKKFAGAVEEKEVLNTSVAAAVGKSSKSKVEENNLKKLIDFIHTNGGIISSSIVNSNYLIVLNEDDKEKINKYINKIFKGEFILIEEFLTLIK